MGGPAAPASDGRRPRWSKDADKYLLPHEQPPVIATRRHWAVLIEPGLKALPLLAIGGWLLLLDPDDRISTTVGFLVLVGALGYLALRGGEWWMRHFIVTNRRVLLTTGIVVRTVALLPLRRITDLTYKETLLGQLLGYGTFRFESAGQQQALSEITYLPRADVLYRRVSDLLFGADDADTGDDEGNPEPPPRVARPPLPPSPPRPDHTGPEHAAPESGRRDTEPIPPLRPRGPRSPRVAGRRVRQGGR
ncbi:PH domain-containing protein [Geodermatophilus sp. DF01-2]|uniref:PH domain-containing protein n=1 Tax=Geodermatophilus sp. DF01-2 TaxID=2559610 RepID=UPI0010742B9F|nr:PH domain-containing protein [Geodermatophilus sp. DF01_2]TFV54926.1 PH domain-containing protein [Geodermatophilus sp. DF01_2]